jgi:hypothetical protein
MEITNIRPKVAILLCGHIRTWDRCLSSFVKFMDGVDYDIFIHTYSTSKSYHPYIRDTCNISDNTVEESKEDIIKKLQIPYIKLVVEKEEESMIEIKEVEQKYLNCYQWPNYGPYDDLQVLKGKGISIRTYLQYRKLRLCNELRKDYEKETGIKYDYIIKLRMDLDYSYVSTSLDSLLKLVKRGMILTSSANCQPNDHIYICYPEDMDKLIMGLGTAKIPINREYNPHEYLFISLKTAQLDFNACIHNLGVIRS